MHHLETMTEFCSLNLGKLTGILLPLAYRCDTESNSLNNLYLNTTELIFSIISNFACLSLRVDSRAPISLKKHSRALHICNLVYNIVIQATKKCIELTLYTW